jgi:hypothetical protein
LPHIQDNKISGPSCQQLLQQPISLKKQRKSVVLGLIAAIAIANAILLAAPSIEEQNKYGNIIRPIAASASMVLAIIVVCRQGVGGMFGKAFASLAGGVSLWAIAELIWAYNSIVLGIEVPFPSIADVLWLAGYFPLGLHLFKTSRFYVVGLRKKSTVAVVLGVAAFSSAYIYSLVSSSELSGPDAASSLAITIAYPVLDAILIVPAVLSVINSGKGELTSIPWIFIAWIMTVIADGIFGYTIVTEIAGDVQIWNFVYPASYLTMAAGLYWHNKYFIIGKKTFETIREGLQVVKTA